MKKMNLILRMIKSDPVKLAANYAAEIFIQEITTVALQAILEARQKNRLSNKGNDYGVQLRNQNLSNQQSKIQASGLRLVSD